MGEYLKDKYKFSNTPALVLMGKDVSEERGSQADKLKAELSTYGILINDLVSINIDEKIKNELLNIAVFISEDAEIFNEMCENKELPISKISKNILRTKKFINSWKEYIIVYTLIMGNYSYKYLDDYLKVIEEEQPKESDKKVIDLNIEMEKKSDNKIKAIEKENTSNQSDEEKNIKDNIKGVVLAKKRRKAMILTSNGEFKYISTDEEFEIGDEVEGKISRRLKDYKKPLAIVAAALIMFIAFFTYMYTHVVSTVIVEGTESIRLEINTFNRVVRVSGSNIFSEAELNSLNVKDRDEDTAICRVIEYLNENEKVNNSILITVSGEAIKYGVLKETSYYVSQNDLTVKFNNAGYQHRLN